MIDIDAWMKAFVAEIEKAFGARIEFIGLQGSYSRGEATKDSDIDVVVILDSLEISDLIAYERAAANLANRSLLCGFISGKDELMSWSKPDLFQFYFDTVPIKGSLKHLIPHIGGNDVRDAIHTGVCNIYHMCVHNLLHEKDLGIVKALYKSASFVVQAIHYENTGVYLKKRSELIGFSKKEDAEILKNYELLKEKTNMAEDELIPLLEPLFSWSSRLIKKYA